MYIHTPQTATPATAVDQIAATFRRLPRESREKALEFVRRMARDGSQ